MPPRVFAVTDGVYCVMRRSYFTNSYLVISSGGIVAIDAGMKSHGGDVLAALEELRRPASDVRAILVTHWHNDHAAGAAELKAASGADVYCHAATVGHLSRVKAFAGLRGAISGLIPETGPLVLLKGLLGNAPQRAVTANHLVADGQLVLDEFEAIETPGHTAGHLSYFHRPTHTLFAGDALAVVNQRLRFMARPVTEDLDAARNSIARCLTRDIRHICPGHREPLSQNVAAECARFRALLASNEKWPLLG